MLKLHTAYNQEVIVSSSFGPGNLFVFSVVLILRSEYNTMHTDIHKLRSLAGSSLEFLFPVKTTVPNSRTIVTKMLKSHYPIAEFIKRDRKWSCLIQTQRRKDTVEGRKRCRAQWKEKKQNLNNNNATITIILLTVC